MPGVRDRLAPAVRPLAFFGALLVLAAPRTALAQAGDSTVPDSVPHFPQVTGRNLMGRTLDLPIGLDGDVNVVLVAFKRHQQDDVDTWTPALRALAARRPGLRVYELPTLASGYRIMRGFIDGGMRGGIPDTAVRAATITLYIDKKPFKAALRIEGEGEIHVFVVERGGRILWRAAGRYTPEALAQLEASLGPGAGR